MEQDNEVTLYPELPQGAKDKAQELVEEFKAEMLKAAEAALTDLYCDVSHHLEADSWHNFRGCIIRGICDYKDNSTKYPYDYKIMRQAIFEENKEQIIDDLNQDLVNRIKELEAEVEDFWSTVR